MPTLKAVIIDDEINCCKTLAALLERYCPEIMVSRICKDGQEGLDAIQELSPDIVFLDIEMPRMNAFDMLEKLPSIDFHLIFTTSYDQYALKAFRFSAMDYLLKPIAKEDLLSAIGKIRAQLYKTLPQQVSLLLDRIHHPSYPIYKIALPTMEGLQMIATDSIISGEANDNYTILRLKGGKKITVSITLKEIEEILEDYSFVRVHRCYLANINEIEKYIKGEGGYLVMSDGSAIDVSRSKKEYLLKKLLHYKE